MSDVFSRLAARARDLGPRARPQIAPRFARRTASLPIEEAEVEAPLVETGPPLRREAPTFETPLRPPAPRETPVGVVPPLLVLPIQPAAALRREIAKDASDQPEPALPSVKRTVERVVESIVERRHYVETRPLAAPPVLLRAADAAALRPAEPRRAALDASPRITAQQRVSARYETAEGSPEAIRVSIGRIDVRATMAAPLPVAPAKPRHTPMGLDEYLRRRNEPS
jgi:hypothetical protein